MKLNGTLAELAVVQAELDATGIKEKQSSASLTRLMETAITLEHQLAEAQLSFSTANSKAESLASETASLSDQLIKSGNELEKARKENVGLKSEVEDWKRRSEYHEERIEDQFSYFALMTQYLAQRGRRGRDGELEGMLRGMGEKSREHLEVGNFLFWYWC